jgi:hypothetical protein
MKGKPRHVTHGDQLRKFIFNPARLPSALLVRFPGGMRSPCSV